MAALPAYIKMLFAGFSAKPVSPVLRSPMESGPSKQARINTRVLTQYPVQLPISSRADYMAFLAWLDSDISGGAGWFECVHPVSGDTVSTRIVGGNIEAVPVREDLSIWQIKTTFEFWGR